MEEIGDWETSPAATPPGVTQLNSQLTLKMVEVDAINIEVDFYNYLGMS